MKTFYSKKGERLSKEILNECSAGLTYAAVMKILRKKDIKLNGKRVSSDEKTSVDDEITVYYSAPTRTVKEIYKCDDILTAYKPKGITSDDFCKETQAIYNREVKQKRGYTLQLITERLGERENDEYTLVEGVFHIQWYHTRYNVDGRRSHKRNRGLNEITYGYTAANEIGNSVCTKFYSAIV